MKAIHPSRLAAQRIGAVPAGLFVIVALSIATDLVLYTTGVFPPRGQPMPDALWLLPVAYRIVYSIAGCYLAARLAPDRPMLQAVVLGGIGVALGAAGALATWDRGPDFGPKWYPLVIFAIPLPCAWLGGRLYSMQRRAVAHGCMPTNVSTPTP